MTDHSHVSDLRWDRWLAGELSSDDTVRAIAHAESCATCGARMRELIAGRDAFQLRPVEVSFVPPRPLRRARSIAFSAVAVAAAVVVAIVVCRSPRTQEASGRTASISSPQVASTRPRSESGSHETSVHVRSESGSHETSWHVDGISGERPKGNEPNLVLAAGRAPDLVRISTGDVVHPGDLLQAMYTADRDGFGAVLALDGAGAVNSYVPGRGDLMVGLPAGVDRSFPASTVLDPIVGTERVVILWCQSAQPIVPLLGELRATGGVIAPAGCHVQWVVLDKREAP